MLKGTQAEKERVMDGHGIARDYVMRQIFRSQVEGSAKSPFRGVIG